MYNETFYLIICSARLTPAWVTVSTLKSVYFAHILCVFPQEDTSSQRTVDQQDPSSLAAAEVAALPSPAPQVLEQKEEDSKREPVDEE